MKNWPKPTSVRDIQVFIGFVNFYQRFIQGFSKIVASFTLMLKTTRLSEKLVLKAFRAGNNKVVESGNRVNKTIVDLSKSKNEKSRKLTYMLNIKAIRKPNFLTPNAKKTLNYLRLAFIKALILQHFDLKSHIWIETNRSDYTIDRVLSQLNIDFDVASNNLNLKSNFGQWHSIAYFSRKMILAETRYKTYNAELLVIIKAFKTWCYYLES